MVCDPELCKRLTMRLIDRSRPVQLRTETQQDLINTTGLAAARCVAANKTDAAGLDGHSDWPAAGGQPCNRTFKQLLLAAHSVLCVNALRFWFCAWLSGELWRTMRLAWQPAFQSGSLEGYTDLMDDCAAQLAQVRDMRGIP